VLNARASKEIVVAFMGAVGCGMPRLVNECENDLVARGYLVCKIKLSDYIKEELRTSRVEPASAHYLQYQDIGNSLRKEKSLDILASYAISRISHFRAARNPGELETSDPAQKVAYLIDQVKHPQEIKLLRLVYRNLFYAVGVMSTAKDRKNRLMDDGISEPDANEIMNRDRKESHAYGQQLEKAFKMADYYVHHPIGDSEAAKIQLKRFGDIVHGDNKVSPSKEEYAMYVAHSTSLKSTCLSRQVGAAILDADSNLIAVGANDVPAPGGGLYPNDRTQDGRCIQIGHCENDAQKKKRRLNITSGIAKFLSSESLFDNEEIRSRVMEKAELIADEAYNLSGIGDLIEFSRAVHAEMDALISLSRGTSGSSLGGSLYTTTFPCHNCARHIVAAGISKVFYIEPYEKSLALDSHSDAIALLDYDDQSPSSRGDLVKFIHFSGVAPGMYAKVFHRPDGRKDGGVLIEFSGQEDDQQTKIVREYLDSYRDFELKISAMFAQDRSAVAPVVAVVPPVGDS